MYVTPISPTVFREIGLQVRNDRQAIMELLARLILAGADLLSQPGYRFKRYDSDTLSNHFEQLLEATRIRTAETISRYPTAGGVFKGITPEEIFEQLVVELVPFDTDTFCARVTQIVPQASRLYELMDDRYCEQEREVAESIDSRLGKEFLDIADEVRRIHATLGFFVAPRNRRSRAWFLRWGRIDTALGDHADRYFSLAYFTGSESVA